MKKLLFRLIQEGEKTKEALLKSGIKPYLIRIFLNEGWAYWQTTRRKVEVKTSKPNISYGDLILNRDQSEQVVLLESRNKMRVFWCFIYPKRPPNPGRIDYECSVCIEWWEEVLTCFFLLGVCLKSENPSNPLVVSKNRLSFK